MKILVAGILFICALAQLQASANTDEPAAPQGLWSWCKQSTQQLLEIRVSFQDGLWSLSVSDKVYRASEKVGKIAFALPDKQSLSIIEKKKDGLDAIWSQPALSHYGYYSKMQTRFNLQQINDNHWQGSLNPQPRPFHLFLDIFRDEQKLSKAVVRNPEGNDIYGKTLFDVKYEGKSGEHQKWALTAKRGNRHISIPFTLSDNNSIKISHPRVPAPVILSKSSGCDITKYYSRLPGEKSLRQTVEDLKDGWEVADAEANGFNVEVLDALINKLANADPRSASPQLLHSLLVSHKGKLVLEEYFYGHNASSVHDTRSLAKVFGSVMIGVAQQQKRHLTPDYNPLRTIYSELNKSIPKNKDSLMLEHFLTYSTGLDTAEDDISPGSEDMLWQQYKIPFWQYTAELPVLFTPGTRYSYSSASANMIGAAIQQVTRQSPHSLFHESIAKPLSFANYHWNLGNDDIPYLGGGVYLRPRDILKIGALYAANGRWDGQQIIPETWIEQSTKPRIAITPETTGLSQEAFSNSYAGGNQAYIWLVDDIVAKNQVFTSYQATGNGGQVIVVVPALELAVGFTGGNYRMGRIWSKWRQDIVGDYIIPALPDMDNAGPGLN